jgi:hypothetical protein
VFKFGAALGLHRLIPSPLLRKSNFMINYLFGVKQKEDKEQLKQILNDTDPRFLKWAINAIAHWKNSDKPAGIKIHGSNDKVLPLKTDADSVIEEGGHFMIVTRGKEISELIEKEINNN